MHRTIVSALFRSPKDSMYAVVVHRQVVKRKKMMSLALLAVVRQIFLPPLSSNIRKVNNDVSSAFAESSYIPSKPHVFLMYMHFILETTMLHILLVHWKASVYISSPSSKSTRDIDELDWCLRMSLCCHCVKRNACQS